MWRFVAIGGLLGGLALGGAPPVAAIDYAEPILPPQSLRTPPASVAAPTDEPAVAEPLRLMTQGTALAPAAVTPRAGLSTAGDPPEPGSAGVAWLLDGAAGQPRYIPNSQWSTGGGCALWNCTTC